MWQRVLKQFSTVSAWCVILIVIKILQNKFRDFSSTAIQPMHEL